MMKHKEKILSCRGHLAVHLQKATSASTQMSGRSIRSHVADRFSNWTDFCQICNKKF